MIIKIKVITNVGIGPASFADKHIDPRYSSSMQRHCHPQLPGISANLIKTVVI